MGKIVKYCSSCDEGFAEKFGFCPNCAAPLQAFEMNPLGGVDKATDPIVEVPRVAAADTQANLADTILEMPEPVEPPAFIREAKAPEIVESEPIEVANADVIEDEPAPVEPAPVEPEPVWATAPSVPVTETYSGAGFHNYEAGAYTKEDDGGYYVTVIQEKNVAQRNLLLLGALGLMLTLSVGSYFASLFQKEIGVGAIGDDRSIAMLLEDVPMPVEEEEKKKADEDSGGGGGGGRNEKEETSQGDLADQTKNPIIRPDAKIYKTDNPNFLQQPVAATEGDQKFEKKYGKYGDPNRFGQTPSNGPGSGGGQGSGNGQGQGSGNGTGAGSGNGSGSGSGDGTGNGPGSGDGTGSRIGEPPPKPVGVTSPLRILANPRATYTEAARTNNVQGSVLVKVTLLASGQVGSVTVVRGLPHGLSEKAIAAAKLIRFEPKKVNGVPVTSVKTMEYTFSIY